MPATNKSTQYGLIALKLLVLGLTGMLLYSRITSAEQTLWQQLARSMQSTKAILAPLILGLAILNWWLEILKWHLLVKHIRPLTQWEAARQCLASFSASAITPNRLGEYAFKCFYFKRKHRKHVLLLKLHTNLSQLLITLILGVPGLFIVAKTYSLGLSYQKILLLSTVVLLIGILIYLVRHRTMFLKGFSLKRVWRFYGRVTRKAHLSVAGLALLRYVVFGTLFLILLHFYGANITLAKAIPLLMAMYLLSSILPTFVLFDFVVKGGVAVWLFSFAGVPHWTVINAVFTMWLLSFALPATLGAYYVVRFKPDTS